MAYEKIIAASPSWYCTRVTDANEHGIFCFGSINILYFMNVKETPQFTHYFTAHSNRIVGVSLCAFDDDFCCTAGEDGIVKQWNWKTKSLADSHNHHKGLPTTIDWCSRNKNIIVSGDDKGHVIVWKLSQAEHQLYSPESGCVTALKSSTSNGNHVAVGYKTGSVYVIDISKGGKIVNKFRGHDEEIHCLSWQPDHGNPFEETANLLLASGSKDKTIKIWSSESDRLVHNLKLPTAGRRGNYSPRVWLTLTWLRSQPFMLMSTGFNADILQWDLTKSVKSKQWSLVSNQNNGHSRLIFNMCLGGPKFETLCTISQDRQVILWNVETMKIKYTLPTIGGFTRCIDQSPLNPGQLAFGSGDQTIRVWNTQNTVNPYEAQSYWQGLKSQVSAVKWHPGDDGVLAYGTEDGRVGIYNFLRNNSRSAQISNTFHLHCVYTVTWGPPCTGEGGITLYSCGDGVIYQHNAGNLETDAINITRLLGGEDTQAAHTCIAWSPDYDVLAIGHRDGLIEVYTVPALSVKCCLRLHHNYIGSLSWHPHFTAESSGGSKCKHWLASAADDKTIQVVDVSSYIDTDPDSIPEITKSMCELNGHTSRVSDMSWSTHKDGMLATSSFDHSVQVWDVNKVEPISNYRGHSSRVMCVQWSLIEPDIVYSGSADCTLHSWCVHKQTEKVPPPPAERDKKKKTKAKKSADTKPSPPSDSPSSVEELMALLAERKKQLTVQPTDDGKPTDEKQNIPANVPAKTEVKTEQRNVGQVSGASKTEGSPVKSEPSSKLHDYTKKERKKKRYRPLFPLSNVKEHQNKPELYEDCVRLAKLCNKGASVSDDTLHLAHFVDGDRTHLYDLIKYEGEHHEEQGHIEQRFMLDVFTGDVKGALDRVVERGQVTEYIMSMAPLASPQTWRRLCYIYSEQLEKAGYLHKAAGYLLAAADVYKAITLYTRNKCFKDALCLAKARLSPFDPVIKQVTQQWAAFMVKEGGYETAVKCFIALGEPAEAAKVLTRRGDKLSLKTAMLVCEAANEMSSFKSYAQKYIFKCITTCDWVGAGEVVNQHEEFMSYGLLNSMHECLVMELVKMDLLETDILSEAKYHCSVKSKDSKSDLPEFIIDTNERDPISPWNPYVVNTEPFMQHVLHAWCQHNKFSMDKEIIEAALKFSTGIHLVKQSILSTTEVLLEVSLYLSISMLHLMLGETEQATIQWLAALDVCDQKLQQGLFRLLLPQGPCFFINFIKQARALSLVVSHHPDNLALLFGRRPSDCDVTRKQYDFDTQYFTDAPEFNAVDCLNAQYALCVTNFLINTIESRISDNNQASTNYATSDAKENDSKFTSDQIGGIYDKIENISTKLDRMLGKTSGRNGGKLSDDKDGIVVSESEIKVDLTNSNSSVKVCENGDGKSLSQKEIEEIMQEELTEGGAKPDIGGEEVESKLESEGNEHVTFIDDTGSERSSISKNCDDRKNEQKSNVFNEWSQISDEFKMSKDSLEMLSKLTLWTVQAEKVCLDKSLVSIQSTISKIIKENPNIKRSKSSDVTDGLRNVENGTTNGNDLGTKEKVRRRSGPYMLMSGGSSNSQSPLHIAMPCPLASQAMFSPLDGYEKMYPPSHECTELCASSASPHKIMTDPLVTQNVSKRQNSEKPSGHLRMDSVDSLTDSALAQTEIYCKARSIFSDESETEKARKENESEKNLQSNCDTEPIPSIDKDEENYDKVCEFESVDKPSELTVETKEINGRQKCDTIDLPQSSPVSGSNDHLSNSAALPSDAQYKDDRFTLDLLEKEENNIKLALEKLKSTEKHYKFPVPQESAARLLHLLRCLSGPEVDTLREAIVCWLQEHDAGGNVGLFHE